MTHVFGSDRDAEPIAATAPRNPMRAGAQQIRLFGSMARLDVRSARSLWNVKGAVLRAPIDPVKTIDRIEHVVGETTEFTSAMTNLTG